MIILLCRECQKFRPYPYRADHPCRKHGATQAPAGKSRTTTASVECKPISRPTLAKYCLSDELSVPQSSL